MITHEVIIKEILKDPYVKNLGLSEEGVRILLGVSGKAILKTLIDYGYVFFDDAFRADIVSLRPRVHVLRGKPYQSTKRYKLKIRLGKSVHEKIEAAYDQL